MRYLHLITTTICVPLTIARGAQGNNKSFGGFHSDNGPPSNSVNEFENVISSPEYPQSDGKIENAVKNV